MRNLAWIAWNTAVVSGKPAMDALRRRLVVTEGGADGSQARSVTFRELLESAPDAMVIVDSDGRIVLVNAQTERLSGYPRAELLGDKVEKLVPQRARSAHRLHREGYAQRPKVRKHGVGARSGYDATRQLKSWPETQDIPVIALTAAAMLGDRRRGTDTGFHRYLTKPVRVTELLATLEELFSKEPAGRP